MKQTTNRLLLALALLPALAHAGPGADLLFQGSHLHLSRASKNHIYGVISDGELKPDPSGKTLIDDQGRPAPFTISTANLQGKGNIDIMIIGGNDKLSSVTASSVWGFTKTRHGHYAPQFGFPAASYEILKTRHHGFYDIQFGTAGFCHPVWAWTGQQYGYLKNVTEPEDPKGTECGEPRGK